MLVNKLSRFAFCFGLTASMGLAACADDEGSSGDEAGDTGDTGDTADDTTAGNDEVGTDDMGTTSDGETTTGETAETETADEGTETTETGEPDPLDPLPDAPVGEWEYVEIEGTSCRDGSAAGVAVRYADNSDKVAFFFEGGGACFNSFTCGANSSSIDPGQYNPGPFGGALDNANPDNPLMDYNFIYVPYCTGDVFMGTTENGNIQGGPQGQLFVGHNNIEIILDRVIDTFPDATAVVDTGVSAGGFGAAANYDTVASYFPEVDVVLIDDSGPLFRDEYLAPCLQEQMRAAWGVNGALPEDCEGCFNADGGGLYNYLPFIDAKYPNAPKGLISSHEDGVIKLFFGFGSNDCNAFVPSFPNYTEALYDLRDNVLTGDNWGTFYKTGTSHTYMGGSDYYQLEVSGVLLVDWVADLMDGVPSHVAP